MKRKSIHDLELVDFENYTIWLISDYDVGNGIDSFIEPKQKYSIDDLKQNDYWVRVECKMSDGTEFNGISLLSYYDHLLSNHSFYYNEEWHAILFKPAPDFVLEKKGPIPFSKKINKSLENIFPISISTDLYIDGENLKITNTIDI